MNERMGVVIPVSSPNHVPDLLADVEREVKQHGADVVVVLVDNADLMRVSGGALHVGGRPVRLDKLNLASVGGGRDIGDIKTANVVVGKAGRNMGWREGTQGGTSWLLANRPDVELVAFANDDIRLSPGFFGTMERAYQSVSASGADPRALLAPLYDDAFAVQVPDYLGPAEMFPDAGNYSWRNAGVVDGTFQMTSREGAEMMVLPGLTGLGGRIPWINDKIIAILCAAPLESVPFLQAALKVAGELAGVDARVGPHARVLADRAAARLLRGMPQSEFRGLEALFGDNGGQISHGVTAVADGAYINHKRHATYIEDLRAQNPEWKNLPAEDVFSKGMHQEGLENETGDFACFKLGVAALAARLENRVHREPTATRAVVTAIMRTRNEPGAWAQVLKDAIFGAVEFKGFVEPAPELRKRQWLQRNPQFQPRDAAGQGVA